MVNRVCSKCGVVGVADEEAALSSFSKSTSHADGYRKECKRCQSDYQRLYYLRHPKKRPITVAAHAKHVEEEERRARALRTIVYTCYEEGQRPLIKRFAQELAARRPGSYLAQWLEVIYADQ